MPKVYKIEFPYFTLHLQSGQLSKHEALNWVNANNRQKNTLINYSCDFSRERCLGQMRPNRSCRTIDTFAYKMRSFPVHTDAFSFENNANILLRFHVPSTHRRCIDFDENANFLKTLTVSASCGRVPIH